MLKGATLKELIGKECQVTFSLPGHKWPIEGYPAFVVVEGADSGMVKMKSRWGGSSQWISTSIIETIAGSK